MLAPNHKYTPQKPHIIIHGNIVVVTPSNEFWNQFQFYPKEYHFIVNFIITMLNYDFQSINMVSSFIKVLLFFISLILCPLIMFFYLLHSDLASSLLVC